MSNSVLVEAYREIPLENSDLFVIVDERDYSYLMQWKWKICKTFNHGYYVYRATRNVKTFMHREVVCLHFDEPKNIRHLNGNTLDNRIENLEGNKLARPPVKTERRFSVERNKIKLTPRQKEIIELLSFGNSREEIALKLGVTTSTVNAHLDNAYNAIGVHTTVEAISLIYGSDNPKPVLSNEERKTEAKGARSNCSPEATSGEACERRTLGAAMLPSGNQRASSADPNFLPFVRPNMSYNSLKRELYKHKRERLILAQHLSFVKRLLKSGCKDVHKICKEIDAGLRSISVEKA